MTSKTLLDVKTWEINGYLIHLEHYDSEIIVKDENGNRIKISKKEPLSIILDLIGSFKTD